MSSNRSKKSKGGFIKKLLILFFSIIVVSGCFLGYNYYKKIYDPNVFLGDKKNTYLYVPTGSGLTDVVEILVQNNFIENRESFEWLAGIKEFKEIKPGRYLIQNKMSNAELINLLRIGKQDPVKLHLNQVRTKQQLAGIIGNKLESDSVKMLDLLNDNDFLKKYNLNSENIMMLFLPDSYEFYWNTDPETLFDRMASEFKKFWTAERKKKAESLGLSMHEVTTLASIVEQETARKDERPVVAGVYLNRLKKGMPLQADPTLIYAIGDFAIRRVLNMHKEIDSPYNTYKFAGLPPGPICLPSRASINSVLDYKKHHYFYFCAKEDFSGYHNFAETYPQHLLNARRFQKELDRRNIQ